MGNITLFTDRNQLPAEIAAAWEVLAEEYALKFAPADGGREVVFEKGNALRVNCGSEKITVVYNNTAAALRAAGLDIRQILQNNDAYHALEAVDGLIKTGPTGTNVNDVAVVLINSEK